MIIIGVINNKYQSMVTSKQKMPCIYCHANALTIDVLYEATKTKLQGTFYLKSVRVHFAPGKIAITLELLG